MTNYKEILTKAIIGKHHKISKDKFIVECDVKPDTVLGCWVINHTFKGINNNGAVNISGTYDVNVWYSFENDTKTKVTTKTYSYNDLMNINNKLNSSSELIVTCLKQPSVIDVKAEDGVINVNVEKDMAVEIIGSTTVKIATEDDFDDYEEIVDDEKSKELDINTDELDDNYLTVNK